MNTVFTIKRLVNLIIAIGLVSGVLSVPSSIASYSCTDISSFIVQGIDTDQVAQLVESYGGEVTSHLVIINGVGATLSERVVAQLLAEPQISSITLDATVSLTNGGKPGAPPSELKHVKDKHTKSAPETNYPDVTGADITWENGVTGDGVTVAVVDTGLDEKTLFGNDKEAAKRLIGWADFVDNKHKPQDRNGHGTHITGIIANPQIGEDGEWNGIAPQVNIVSVRVLNKEGFGTYQQVIQGIQWAVNHKDKYNIKVMNLSLVSPVQSPYWTDPLNQAVTRAWAEGITVVVAAGNNGPDPMTIGVPGNNPYVITVGAFTDNFTPNDWSDDYITPFSAAGPTLDGFVKPDVLAPGAHMVSTMPERSYLAQQYKDAKVAKDYYQIAGTSQSAAVVSGIAALVLDANDLSPDEVKFRVMGTAFPWINLETEEALYSIWQQGMGRINAPDAVYADIVGVANNGMDIEADLAGTQHYEGYTYYDEELGQFVLRGGFGSWAGGFGSWAGGFGSWAGGFGSWAGSFGSWAGEFGSWAGEFGSWAGGFGSWAGGFGSWAGGFGSWAGGFGSWAGGFGSWAGGFGSWAGSVPWSDTAYNEELFVTNFLNGKSPEQTTSTTSIGIIK